MGCRPSLLFPSFYPPGEGGCSNCSASKVFRDTRTDFNDLSTVPLYRMAMFVYLPLNERWTALVKLPSRSAAADAVFKVSLPSIAALMGARFFLGGRPIDPN